MRQLSFADVELSNCEKTNRERFLDSMDGIVPWERWVALIRPHYPSGSRGRTPRGIETMLRMYLLQNWFNLSDRGAEDQIKDSIAPASS